MRYNIFASIGSPESNDTFTPPLADMVVDNLNLFNNHRYNKFPQNDSFSDGELIYAWASSVGHTDNGWLMIANSRTGGASLTTPAFRPFINGVQPTTVCVNISVDDNDRVWLFYQDDEVYNQCKAAYSDDRGQNFTYIGQHIWTEAVPGPASTPGVVYCQFGTARPTMMPEGDGIITYYAYPFTTTNVATIGTLRFSISGITQGGLIRETTETVYPNDGTNETELIIIERGLTNATTTIVALGRRNFGQFFYLDRSYDGGQTWTRDQVNFVGYNFGSLGNVPIAGIVYDGTNVVLAVCTRGFSGGVFVSKVLYLTVNKTDLLNNVVANFSVSTELYYDTYARDYGSEVDFGYGALAKQRHYNKVFIVWYGAASDSASNFTGNRWLAVKQLTLPL